MSSKELSSAFTAISTSRKLRVLLIDAQVECLIPLNLILKNLGLDVTLAFDGFKARNLLKTEMFDLVIIDWNMPDLNGNACLEFTDTTFYLENKRHPVVPYVVYSGHPESLVESANTLYFKKVDHWSKPMTVSQLTRRILKTLGKVP